MSKTKSGGKVRQHSTRPGKRLGVKLFGGQQAKTGMIIVRQKGTKFHAGDGVGMGRDHTLFATRDGSISFKKKHSRSYVSVTTV